MTREKSSLFMSFMVVSSRLDLDAWQIAEKKTECRHSEHAAAGEESLLGFCLESEQILFPQRDQSDDQGTFLANGAACTQ
jgi:hypothetical protein